jgi:osmotically-inducible protein OsmY
MKGKILTILSLAIVMAIAACGGKSDADLQKAVQDKLATERITGVTVAVKDGVATLGGEVADITVKNRAGTAANVEGIKSVQNNITLKPLPTPVPPPADPALKGKVDEALRKAGCTGAVATIADGTVTLTGTVPSAKYAECIQVVNESGAGKLNNQLQRGN